MMESVFVISVDTAYLNRYISNGCGDFYPPTYGLFYYFKIIR